MTGNDWIYTRAIRNRIRNGVLQLDAATDEQTSGHQPASYLPHLVQRRGRVSNGEKRRRPGGQAGSYRVKGQASDRV